MGVGEASGEGEAVFGAVGVEGGGGEGRGEGMGRG